MTGLYIVLFLFFLIGGIIACISSAKEAEYRFLNNLVIAMIFLMAGGFLVEIKYSSVAEDKTERIIRIEDIPSDTITNLKTK